MTTSGEVFIGSTLTILITVLAAVIIFLSAWFRTKKSEHRTHVDNMAGDEGDD